jgi:hypothetical protein
MNRPLLVVLGLVVVGASGCGWTVESAREAGAQKACDYLVRCNYIGAGKNYASRDECLTAQRSSFQTLWPTASCGTLNAANLDTCLKGIDAASCTGLGAILDFASAVSKCTQPLVCQAP